MAEELEIREVEAEGEEKEGEETPELLIFGKYKTLEDAEKGYKELERDFHASRQLPKEKEEAPNFGYVEPPMAPGAAAEDPNEAFYENPTQWILQTVGQIRQLERVATANRKAALRELKTHPAYSALIDRLDDRLETEVDPSYLLNPAAAKEIVTAMFGQELVRHTAEPRPQSAPTSQRRAVHDIEKTAGVTDDGEGDTALDSTADDLLKSLDLPAKSRGLATEAWRRRDKEERRRK